MNAVLRYPSKQARGKRMGERAALEHLIRGGFVRVELMRHVVSKTKSAEELTWRYRRADGETAILRVRFDM